MDKLTPQAFTVKPRAVHAMQVTQKNHKQVAEWCNGNSIYETNGRTILFVVFTTDGSSLQRNTMYAMQGDWVVHDSYGAGAFKSLSDKDFRNLFE